MDYPNSITPMESPFTPLGNFPDAWARRRWIFNQPLSPAPKLLLLALELHARMESGYCRLNISTLIIETSMSRNTIKRALRGLEADGYLQVKRHAVKGQSSEYWLLAKGAILAQGVGHGGPPGVSPWAGGGATMDDKVSTMGRGGGHHGSREPPV